MANSNWTFRSLKDCATWFSGGTPNKATASYWGGTIPWISAKSLTDFYISDSEDRVTEEGSRNGTRLVPENTILFIVRGMSLKSEFRMGITTRPVTFNQDLKALVAVNDIVPTYLAYAIRANTADILKLVGEAGHGTGVLPTDRIQAVEIPVPSVVQQQAIAEILKSLDDKIELNRKMSETLEAMAQAIFKAWFVDFEPVRAKMEGHWQHGQSLPGLPADLFALFPDRFVESHLGAIPKGWNPEPLSNHCDAVKGVSYKGSELSPDDGMPLHNLNSVCEGGGYKYEGLKYYKGEFAERHLVSPGDLIVANTEQGHNRLLIGYAAIVPSTFGQQGIVSHHIYRLTPKSGSALTAMFLCYVLNSTAMHDIVSGYANGTTVNMLPVDGVQKPSLPIPPVQLVKLFDEFSSAIHDRQQEIVLECQTLVSIRDTLLPKLISGELRVKDAQRFIERAS